MASVRVCSVEARSRGAHSMLCQLLASCWTARSRDWRTAPLKMSITSLQALTCCRQVT